jgi:hypothetical protein
MAFHLFVNRDDSMYSERSNGPLSRKSLDRNFQNNGKKTNQDRKFETGHTCNEGVV